MEFVYKLLNHVDLMIHLYVAMSAWSTQSGHVISCCVCHSGEEPHCWTDGMVPLPKSSAIPLCEYDPPADTSSQSTDTLHITENVIKSFKKKMHVQLSPVACVNLHKLATIRCAETNISRIRK